MMKINRKLSVPQQADLDEVLAFNKEAYALRYQNPELGLEKINQAFSLFKNLPIEFNEIKKAKAECLVTVAGFRYLRSEFEAGVTALHEALHFFELLDDDYGMARACNIYGVIYQSWGEFAEALEYYLRAVTHLGDTPKTDYFQIAIIGNLGLVYLEMGEFEEAKYYLLKSLKYAQDIDNDVIAGDVFDNLCKLYTYQKDYERALTYGHQGLEAFTRTKHLRGQADVYNSIGHIHIAQGNPQKALEFHHLALPITQDISHRYEEAESRRFIARALSLMDQTDKALVYIQEALKIANDLKVQQLIYRCYREHSEIYKIMGDFENALKYHEQFYALKEEIFNQDTERRVRMMSLMQQLKDAKDDAEFLQQKNNALKKEIKERKRLQSQLEYIATIDPLTELLNRRAFFNKIEALLFDQSTEEVAVLILDIDNFKYINDLHGHLAGDLALRTIGNRILEMKYEQFLPCRFGGDEFAILLPNATLQQASEFAQHLLTEINTPITFKEIDIDLKASVGIATMAISEFEIDHLLDHADQALYKAKNAGKNQIQTFQT